MATIDIVIPSQRGVAPTTQTAVIGLLRESNCQCVNEDGIPLHSQWRCNNGRHSVALVPSTGNSVVHFSRNKNIALAMYGTQYGGGRPKADYFLFMDDDMVPQPESIMRMASHKEDIVCGICTTRNDPPRPNIKLWNAEKETFRMPIEWDWDSEKLIEIDAAGAAFMLVRRQVLEKMATAYHECFFERLEDKRKYPREDAVDEYWDRKMALRKAQFETGIKNGEWGKADSWWFQFIDNGVDSQLGEMGEDVSFCWKAKKLGYKIFADPMVTPGHIGVYGYGVWDWRNSVDEAKSRGKLKELEANVTGL